jgi:hypothetical protein
MGIFDDDDDQGLPDAAFTEDELAAGVQHLARGDSSHSNSSNQSSQTIVFQTFQEAKEWAKNNPGNTITRCQNQQGFMVVNNKIKKHSVTNESKYRLSPMLFELYTGRPPRCIYSDKRMKEEINKLTNEEELTLKNQIVDGVASADRIYKTAMYYSKNIKHVDASEICSHKEWRDTLESALKIIKG